MARKSKQSGNSKSNRIIALLLCIVLILGAIIIYLYRDEIFAPTPAAEVTSVSTADGEPFTYENGSKQTFALMGTNLAIASSTGHQLLNSEGGTISREVYSMDEPALVTNSDSCVFYAVGGTEFRVYRNEEFTTVKTEMPIISLSMNPSGYITITTEESGYKGSVTVYDDKLEPIYKWYSGTGYTLDAALSSDRKSLAVLCLEPEGSRLRFFSLDKVEELANALIPGELCFKLSFTDSHSLSILSQDALHFFDTKGKSLASTDFGDSLLSSYVLSEDLTVIALSKYVSGSELSLTSFSSDGKVLGTASLVAAPTSMSAKGQSLLLLLPDGLNLYARDMTLLTQTALTPGYKGALLLSRHEALLLSDYHCEKYKLK